MKKINTFWSVIKAISAWLHGDGSKHFRAYTYPRIKQFTRKFVTLGLYEKIEKIWTVVDDTFYGGIIPEEVQDPTVIAKMEQYAERIESSNEYDVEAAMALPKFKDIKDDLYIWKSIEQGNTYRCATFAMNNMLRTAMLKKGLKPELEVTAIDPLYIETKYGPGKEGTVVDHAFAYLAKNGHPFPSWSPSMTDHNKELAALEGSKTIRNARLFSGFKPTGRIERAYTFDQAVKLDKELPDNWEIQVSIDFSPSLDYFGRLVPGLKKVGGKYSLVRTGGHSVHGVRGSFSTWEDGEAGMAIIDSAYRRSEEGWRFLKSSLFIYGIIRVRFVEYDLEGNTVKPAPTPNPGPSRPQSDDEILAMADISFGEEGEPVKALQRYLISEGHEIRAGVTGGFFTQTQEALKQWQDKHFGPKYTGKYWGSISRQKFIELKRLG